MTFVKEELYQDAQILNPGTKERQKCTPKNRDKR